MGRATSRPRGPFVCSDSCLFRQLPQKVIVRKALKALIVCLAALLGQWPAAAEAHAELVASYPAPGSTLDATHQEIRLTFSERIGPASSVQLFGTQFRAVPGVRSWVDLASPEQLRAIPPQLTPDTYTVEWDAISADGHEVSGSYAFTIVAPAAAPAQPQVAWLSIAAPLALLAVGVAWGLARSRRGAASASSNRPGGVSP